jgi:preprotein translocase subunit SecE
MSDSKKDAAISEKAEKKAKKAKSDADSKKSKKSNKKDKKSIFKRIANWFQDLKREFKRVSWPTKKTVFNNSLVVLGVVVIGSAFIGLIDLGFLSLINYLMSLA